MKAIILAGGKGQRLRPMTFAIPKPMIPIDEKPILELLLLSLKKYGITEVILAVGYKSQFIESYFGDGSQLGMKIEHFKEETPLGTAGPLKVISEKYGLDEDVLVMNGDILTKMDFSEMIRFHKDNNNALTVGTATKRLKTKYGVIQLEGDSIVAIKEKPAFPVAISAGIYIVSPRASSLMPEGFFNMNDLINLSVANKLPVKGFSINHYWSAIDRMVDYEKAQEMASGELKEWISDLTK